MEIVFFAETETLYHHNIYSRRDAHELGSLPEARLTCDGLVELVTLL